MDHNYRSPICSVLGHVDAGKTLFLDRLRNSNVQGAEPGGITQKIGVTYLNRQTLQDMVGTTKNGTTFGVPGIMFVDTPGHECFTAQRLTGVEISDLVIVVVDIFKGLEQQTIESLSLLRKSKTPCIIIANKTDRIQNWVSEDGRNIRKSYKSQTDRVRGHYDDYIKQIVLHCAVQGLNAELYYRNKNHKEFISIVPFSAKTGEGMPDLLMMISILCTKYLPKRIQITNNVTTGFMIERMIHKSYGAIITTVLTDGQLRAGDSLIFRDSFGDIIDAKIKRIFIPLEKMEVKDRFNLDPIQEVLEPSSFVLNLDYGGEILTGTRFYLHTSLEEKEEYSTRLIENSLRNSERSEYEYSKRGVYLVSPTIGMLDALYNLCNSREIPISGSKIGFISKKTVIRANPNIDSETKDEEIYNRRYSVILGYGLGPSKEVVQQAEQNHVRIMTNDVIYRLLDDYENLCQDLNSEIRERNPSVRFPFRAEIFPQYIFRTDNPILIGVKVVSGTLHMNQSISAIKDGKRVRIGTIMSIQNNKDEVESAKENAEVCLKIDNSDTRVKYGKEFNEEHEFVPMYTQDEQYLITNYPEIFE
jgi:translation initiation factor 5B